MENRQRHSKSWDGTKKSRNVDIRKKIEFRYAGNTLGHNKVIRVVHLGKMGDNGEVANI